MSIMVLAYHIILSAYGFWLPNDPRGSWSTTVWAKHLRSFGQATKVQTRRSVAQATHDPRRRQQAKQHLNCPPVKFSGIQARAIARGFAAISNHLDFNVHACAVLPDHVHLVIARHQMDAEVIGNCLKRAATRQLNKENLHPLHPFQKQDKQTQSPWASGGWYVYLNSAGDIHQRIRYVEQNPPKAGLPQQRWRFVKPYGAPRGRGG